MKCSQLYRILTKDGWYAVSQKGSHVKMRHETKNGTIIFPNHGSQEMKASQHLHPCLCIWCYNQLWTATKIIYILP